MKGDRDSAGAEIASCREQAAGVKQELDQVSGSIAEIKADQRRMSEMRAMGYSVWSLTRSIWVDEGLLADARSDIDFLKTQMDDFLLGAKHHTGSHSLEEEIRKVQGLRDAFIKSFDTTEARTRRQSEHRQEWLFAHQRGH